MLRLILNSKVSQAISLLLVFIILFESCKKESIMSSSSINQIASNAQRVEDLSGADLFRGIFFADGEAVEYIPELYDFRASNFFTEDSLLEIVHSTYDGIIEFIGVTYPGFYDVFKEGIQSGDQLQITNTIKEAIPLLTSALEVYYSEGFQTNADSSATIEAERKRFETEFNNAQIDKNNPAEITAFIKEYLTANDLNYAYRQNACIINIIVLISLVVVAVVAVAEMMIAIVLDIALWTDPNPSIVSQGTSRIRSDQVDGLLAERIINSIAENLKQ